MTNTTTPLTFSLDAIISHPENKTAWGWELENAWGIVGLPRTTDGEKPADGEYVTPWTIDFSSTVTIEFDEERGEVTLSVTHLDESVEDESDDERWRCLGGSLALYTGSNALPEKGDELFFFGKAEWLAVKSFVHQGTVFYAALSGYED
jgi:hypothetical protein